MSFGAIITAGEDNQPLEPDLMKWLVEIRVEQDINNPTRFAIRFEDNVCEGDFELADQPALQTNTMISVIAPANDTTLRCLVRGPVTEVKTEKHIGATGTWVEIHGEDRRVEMNREIVKSRKSGTAEAIASQILADYSFTPDAADASQQYDDTTQRIQRGSDLNFLNEIASENGLDFWISYDVADSPLPNAPYSISETAHLKLSPPEGVTTAAAMSAIPVIAQQPSLRINVAEDEHPNVNVFRCQVAGERANQASGSVVDVVSTEAAQSDTDEGSAKINSGNGANELDNLRRYIDIVATGDSAELLRYQRAALREESWHINADISVSVHQLETILVPHDLVPVIGAGEEMSVVYQVKSAVHVINASQHLMDLSLRSNSGGAS